MAKTVVVVKRFLDVTLVVLILGAVGVGVVLLDIGLTKRVATIQVPAHFAPDGRLLEVQNNVLGAGFVGEAAGEVSFEAPLASWPALLYVLGLALSFAPAFVLVVLLRRIAATLVAGDPFAEANVNRIRALGALTMALEFFRGAAQLGLETLVMATSTMRGFALVSWGEWNSGVFVLGMVIIALAEVFRYGMQLQADVDLTV